MKSVVLVVCLFVASATCGRQGVAAGDVQTLIDQSHPWRVTQQLAPALRDPRTRTPQVVLAAARAAAGWGGWSEVDKLLVNEPWLDTQFDGEGRELLARSALANGTPAAAVALASSALADARQPDQRGARGVLLARALERTSRFDSAAVAYARAEESLPSIRDGLALRAAGNESDSSARAHRYASVGLAVARSRRALTEAEARERFGDTLGAAARYASLGLTVNALRLRLGVTTDTAQRDAIAGELLAFIASHRGSADARAAVDVLDKGFPSLSSEAELTIARGIASSGAPARAITAFQRALARPALVTPADRLLYAQTLARASRTRDALSQLDAVTGPIAAQAEYQRARILLTSGSGDAARIALRDVLARYPGDTASASSALYLLADLSTDDGNDVQARAFYQQLYTAYPSSTHAGSARFNAAMIAFVSGNAGAAGAEFDSLVALLPRADDALAARYWSGRAAALAGDESVAHSRWRDVIAQQPTSYYGVLAARRLGESAWMPAEREDDFPSMPSVDSAFARAELLDRLGMDVESKLEYDALESAATTSERMATTAHDFSLRGQPARAMRLAQRLIDAGQRDARTYRLLYPLPDRDELSRDARAHDLDPALVAGLVRQESGFNPRAISVANARGLMQVLPSVGESVARSLTFPVWSPALLLDADANLQLGTAHLASFVQQYGALSRVLAAYNAGGSRVTRWAAKAGMGDPEVFAERVPFTETRDYVRIVQRNAAIYKVLYQY